MSVEIVEEPIKALALYAEIPIAFLVEKVFDLTLLDDGLGGVVFSERTVEVPWLRDYDAIKGEGPTTWASRFDVTNWGLISAHDAGRRVRGAVVAFNAAGVSLLEGRSDLAVLWDIRVHPAARSMGTGSLIFRAVEAWARDRKCRTLKVETQNTNVAACASTGDGLHAGFHRPLRLPRPSRGGPAHVVKGALSRWSPASGFLLHSRRRTVVPVVAGDLVVGRRLVDSGPVFKVVPSDRLEPVALGQP